MRNIDISSMHDNYGILDLNPTPLAGFPLLKQHSIKTRTWTHYDYDGRGQPYNCKTMVDHYGMKEVANLLHATANQVTMKMLLIFEDGGEHNYREIVARLFPEKGYGHDMDCYRSLMHRKMIDFSSKHARGVKFYKITDFGREVLNVVAANKPYSRIVRWYKMDEEDIVPNMMKADLAGEEAYKDIEPETFIALFEELFSPDSKMRKLGSAYRWMNNIMNLLKTNCEFYEKASHPDILAWLEANKEKYAAAGRFLAKFKRLQKKMAKAA